MDASMLRVLTDDAPRLAGHDWISPEFRCTLRTEALTGEITGSECLFSPAGRQEGTLTPLSGRGRTSVDPRACHATTCVWGQTLSGHGGKNVEPSGRIAPVRTARNASRRRYLTASVPFTLYSTRFPENNRSGWIVLFRSPVVPNRCADPVRGWRSVRNNPVVRFAQAT